MAAVGGVLAAGLFIPAAGAAKAVTDTSARVFDDLPTELRVGTLPQASVVYANDGKTVIARFYDENRTVVPLSKVSKAMQEAMVAVEDKRFYEHGGIDITGTVRALVNNASGKETQGASTLTQQYVKNILIENALAKGDPEAVQAARAQTAERKLREAKLAISLEQKMTKNQILAGYLNIAQFGSRVYGVESAAQYYFSTSAAKLTPLQAATIAGITQAPNQFDPTLNPQDSQRKRNVVLNDLYSQNIITKAQYDKYRTTPIQKTLKVNKAAVANGCGAGKDTSLFCDYITTVIKNNDDEAFSSWGKTATDRMVSFMRGGYKVVTTLDLSDQHEAQKQISRGVPVNGKKTLSHTTTKQGARVAVQLEAAITSVEPGTGEIRAMAQNAPFDGAETSSIKGATSINYTADYAHGGSNGFQAGSSFKPYVLADWLKTGHSLYQEVNGNRSNFTFNDFHSTCANSFTRSNNPWPVGNSEGAAPGMVRVDHATADSINRAYASMATQLDLCDVGKTAVSVGWRASSGSTDATDIQITPAMILGTQQTSPLSQAAAYATFASGGTHCDPVAITSITDPKGKDVAVPSANCDSSALDSGVAQTVNYALEKVLQPGGTAPGHGLSGRVSAGKTGTTNGSAQTWFIGYTPQLSTAVWVGNAQNDVYLQHIEVAGSKVLEGEQEWLYGGTLAAPIWQTYMDKALSGQPAEAFGAPDYSQVNAPVAPKPSTSDNGTAQGGGDQGSTGNGGGTDNSGGGKGNGGGDSSGGGKGNDGGRGNGGNNDNSGGDN